MTWYETNSQRATIKNFFEQTPHTNPDMNITSKSHSYWNAGYTHLMPVSKFDTQGHTNSCYNNALESRELYVQYNNFQICNYYNSNNWNFCSISEGWETCAKTIPISEQP